MKKVFTATALLLFFYNAHTSIGQDISSIEGAWEMNMPDNVEKGKRVVMTIEKPYVFVTTFDVKNKIFYAAQGGLLQETEGGMLYTVEFNTEADYIGTVYGILTELNGDQLNTSFIANGQTEKASYTRIDDGKSDLAGAWRITDRMRDGEMQAMRLGTRKTIKMITGTRFQWAAFDPTTRRFSGTGGGTVTFENGKYTEHIEFFSKNADRVGAVLTFNYVVNEDKWTHSGKSSSGNPIKEIWTKQ